jgi:hypothetical protein
MTLQTPPSWLQAGSYPAQYDRLTQQALYATTGIIGSSSLAITANSPVGMSVLVASGWAAVIGTTTTNMGAYTIFNDAQATLTITTANPTNPRIDLVCATVRDAFYSGADNDVIFQVVAGTPAGSPVAPALPANSISLATVAVAAAATQINAVDITNTRVDVTTNLPVVPNLIIKANIATTYTFILADNNKLVTSNNGSAQTLSIPTNASVAYPIGAQINVAWITGAGQPTINAVTPGTTTILSTGATSTAPKLRVVNSVATCIKIATDTWLVTGDIN